MKSYLFVFQEDLLLDIIKEEITNWQGGYFRQSKTPTLFVHSYLYFASIERGFDYRWFNIVTTVQEIIIQQKFTETSPILTRSKAFVSVFDDMLNVSKLIDINFYKWVDEFIKDIQNIFFVLQYSRIIFNKYAVLSIIEFQC